MTYTVVEFSGFRINQARPTARPSGGQKPLVDWHVIDGRGRTRKVFPHPPIGDWRTQVAERRAAAQEYADQLNAALEREAVQATRETGA